ncbi:MAG: hypothetical protein Q7R95_06375, partial [bacterium]|nr:hypothetical protein [bacterium]
DVLIVGHSDSRWMVMLAKWISDKKIIMDGFYSVYESYTFDRKLFSKYSPKAWYHWIVEFMASHIADQILCDTNQHINYFVNTFRVSKSKCVRVFIGADDSVFKRS